MRRPIGVILLAGAAGLAGLYQLYLMLVYLGWVDFNVIGKAVSFPDEQWGAALWSLLIAVIWFWVAAGFWNLRAYALQFGLFISLFTLIWGFFALLFGNSVEAQTIPWLLAGFIYLYLSYPGVQEAFIKNEMSKLTPEQKEAMESLGQGQRRRQYQGAGHVTRGRHPAGRPIFDPKAPVDLTGAFIVLARGPDHEGCAHSARSRSVPTCGDLRHLATLRRSW